MPHDLEREALTRYLEKHSLKHTRQRAAVLEMAKDYIRMFGSEGKAW